MEYTPEQLEEKMQYWANEAAIEGDKWAVQWGIANSVKDRKNDYLAELTDLAEGKSNAEKERNARLTGEWKGFRESVSEAEALNKVLQISYETKVRNWECARSLLSSMNTTKRTCT